MSRKRRQFGQSCTAATRLRRCGFTLIELIAVLVLVAILSASATPVLRWMEQTRHVTLEKEIDRRLMLARAYATSSGMPAGIRFSIDEQTLQVLRIDASGGAPEPIPTVTGSAASDVQDQISTISPGAALLAIDLEDSGAYETLWFDYDGTPHFRAADGAFVANADRQASVSLSGGRSLTIHPVSGLVE